MTFRLNLSISAQKSHLGFFNKSTLNVWILIVLYLLIHRCRMFFHLLRYSFISLNSVLQFSVYMSYTSLVWFILSDILVSGIVFLNFLSGSLVVVYRNKSWFSYVDLVSCNLVELVNEFNRWDQCVTLRLKFMGWITCGGLEWLVIYWKNKNKKHHHHLGFDLADRRGHLLVGLAPDIDKRGMSWVSAEEGAVAPL